MSECSEVKIIIKNEEQKYIRDFLCYEELTISRDCEQLKDMVNQSLKEFKGTPDDILVTVKFNWW